MTLSKYNEIMDRITVTDEMRHRIMDNIGSSDMEHNTKNAHRFPGYVQILSLAACLALIITGIVSVPGLINNAGTDNPPPVELAGSGICTAASAQELTALVGFDIADIPSLAAKSTQTCYAAYDSVLAEISYSFGDQTICFRKSHGSDDNSGDYNDYEICDSVSISGYDVTLKGDRSGYCLATWSHDGYAYSLRTSVPVSLDEFRSIIAGIE